MHTSLLLSFAVLVLALSSGCDGGVSVDTSPIGVGLACIAGALFLSAFVGGDK
jgi:hypothetical protein